jgi:hypothetical protein
MKSLDEQIGQIEKLDQARRRAKKLQAEAVEALTAHPYRPRRRDADDAPDETRSGWAPPSDDIEKAELLRALVLLEPRKERNKEIWRNSKNAVKDSLEQIKYDDCIRTGRPENPQRAVDRIPIFRCALVLQALAQTPGYALKEAALSCLFCIVQELHEVAGPTWVSGAARAGKDAVATAFVTAECARALLALEGALLQTARAVELLGEEVTRASKLGSGYDVWQQQEETFRNAALKASLGEMQAKLLIDLSGENSGLSPQSLIDRIASELDGLLPGLADKIDADAAKYEQSAARKSVENQIQEISRSQHLRTAREIAHQLISKFLGALQGQAELDEDGPSLAEKLARRLRRGARLIRELLQPLEQFANSIIDRELAAGVASLDMPVDAAELLFAANLLGLVSDWGKPKIRAAYEVLRPKLSVNGRLLSFRPFDVDETGYRLIVQSIEVTRRMADLVANTDVPPEPDFVERLMRPFEDTRVSGDAEAACGWTIDAPGREKKSLWWATALVADALESVIRMLNQAINRQVLAHFLWRRPGDLSLRLDDLFYPDFGLAASKSCAGVKESDRDSVAAKLQKLREHAGHGPKKSKIFSLVLYGPPGTGKTTLVEALAKSADVPLVEITPSDILVGGEEAIERRTRHVFQALSKLTHVVILFDEFDPILQDRAKRDASELPKSIFEFLTPGMLPKLKALNEAGKEQRFSYVLATNFVYDLDPAVIRKGRFDDKCGIFPPDAISRRGRLLEQLSKARYKREQIAEKRKSVEDKLAATSPDDVEKKKRLIEEQEALQKQQNKKLCRHKVDPPAERIDFVLIATAGGPMDQLARPGWFTLADDDKDFDGTLFGCLFEDKPMPEMQPETTYREESRKHRKAREKAKKQDEPFSFLEKLYWDDWRCVVEWDCFLKKEKKPQWEDLHARRPMTEGSE